MTLDGIPKSELSKSHKELLRYLLDQRVVKIDVTFPQLEDGAPSVPDAETVPSYPTHLYMLCKIHTLLSEPINTLEEYDQLIDKIFDLYDENGMYTIRRPKRGGATQ